MGKSSTKTLLSQFASARDGNVALLFSVLLLPILGTVGASIDYAIALGMRNKMQLAIDAASISAVSKASPAFNSAGGMTGNGTIATGIADARKIYEGNIANLTGYDDLKLDVAVMKVGDQVVSELSFKAVVKTSFLSVIGIDAIPIAGTAKSSATVPKFIDFYLLLDNSPSMGVAATVSEIARMKDHTPDNCAFACHDLSNKTGNNYMIAKKFGITTRIDVLRQATQQLMDTAAATQTMPNQFRMALYDFGDRISATNLRQLHSLSSSLSSVRNAAAKIDLMSVNYHHENNDQGTNFTSIVPKLDKEIGTPGAGSSAAPQKYVFFVTDGVADEDNANCAPYPLAFGNRCHSPLNAKLCDVFKKRGIKVAVLYTTYLDLPDNDWYNQWIKPFNPGPYSPSKNSKIASSLEACASPGLFFEVGMDQGISQAMNALFQKAVADARLIS